MANVSSIKKRLDVLSKHTAIDDEDSKNFYLVRSDAVMLQNQLLPYCYVAPGLDVDIRPMKQSEFRAILASIDGKSRSLKTLPSDYSKLPEYMKPKVA